MPEESADSCRTGYLGWCGLWTPPPPPPSSQDLGQCRRHCLAPLCGAVVRDLRETGYPSPLIEPRRFVHPLQKAPWLVASSILAGAMGPLWRLPHGELSHHNWQGLRNLRTWDNVLKYPLETAPWRVDSSIQVSIINNSLTIRIIPMTPPKASRADLEGCFLRSLGSAPPRKRMVVTPLSQQLTLWRQLRGRDSTETEGRLSGAPFYSGKNSGSISATRCTSNGILPRASLGSEPPQSF